MRKQLLLAGTPLLAVMLVSSLSAAPQRSSDDRWLAWAGCWQPEGDAAKNLLCIVPEGDGVRMITLADGKVQSESHIVADDLPHSVSQEGCSGTERARWSADRQRVFLHSDLNCGSGITRKVSGIFGLISPSEWVSVQAVTSGGTTGSRIVRYVEAPAAGTPENLARGFRDNRLARETARQAASALLELDDVREAVANVDAQVVAGWLTATAQPFDLNGRKLLALADAGVPASVIDVLVAVSDPEHFAVEDKRASETDSRERTRGRGGIACYDAYYPGSWYDPFSYRRGYGTCYPGGIGYYPWGYYGGYYGGGYVVVVRGKGDTSHGKVTKGGYTSGRSGSTSAQPRGKDSGSGSTSVTRKPSTGTSDSGSTTGSSTSGQTRKAKPRDQ